MMVFEVTFFSVPAHVGIGTSSTRAGFVAVSFLDTMALVVDFLALTAVSAAMYFLCMA